MHFVTQEIVAAIFVNGGGTSERFKGA